MPDREFDDILKDAASAKPDVDPALVNRISSSISSGLLPVRVLPPAWILVAGLVLSCAIVAAAGGMLFGPHGIREMSAPEIGLIFPVLASLILLAAILAVAEAIPGSRRLMAPWFMGAGGCLALAALFGALFHDYRTERFVSQGMACLAAGLATAIPASLAVWFLLRRGFPVNSAAAGFVKGVLCGLAGVAMLEIHCPNFEAPHVIVWHIAVLPISGLAGMLAARFGKRDTRR